MNHFCPNLFVPGAAKSGTTSLHIMLDTHPDICMSRIKEPVYWNKANFKSFNDKKKQWYHNLFEDKKAHVFGESTPSYMLYPDFIKNIKATYDFEPKFIFILRNPIDRAFSHYWWMIGLHKEKRTFKEAFEDDLKREFSPYKGYPDFYYHFGRYGHWISNFYKTFNPDHIKIITQESLRTDTNKTLNSCFEFLGLKAFNIDTNISANKTSKLKYPLLYDFTKKISSGHYSFLEPIKSLIPKTYGRAIKNKLENSSFINKKEVLEYSKPTAEERAFLTSKYAKDVEMLKTISGIEFKEWDDFNN